MQVGRLQAITPSPTWWGTDHMHVIPTNDLTTDYYNNNFVGASGFFNLCG